MDVKSQMKCVRDQLGKFTNECRLEFCYAKYSNKFVFVWGGEEGAVKLNYCLYIQSPPSTNRVK